MKIRRNASSDLIRAATVRDSSNFTQIRPGLRLVGNLTPRAQPVSALVRTSVIGGTWNSADWPFRMTAHPLLILMGKAG